MALILFALLVLVGTVLYLMNPDERKRLAEAAYEKLKDLIRQIRTGRGSLDPLHDLLVTRTKWPIVAPLLAAACVGVWLAAMFGSEPQWQIAWGASYAPRTTTNEWWRLVTYAFVHAGFFHLLATVAALLSLGVVLERLVGHAAFAAVYVAATIVAGVVSLWTRPALTITLGASGAIFGLYGLLIAVIVYGYLRKPRLPWSPLALKRLAAGAIPFLLYNLFSDDLPRVCELAGLGTGMLMGLSLARRIMVQKVRTQRAVLAPALAVMIALVLALPLRGTIDARPAIARIAVVETWTALEYAKAVNEFTQGRLPQKALGQVIQSKILPALTADRTRVDGLRGIPREQRPLVDTAKEYFDLREASWRRRLEGLKVSSVKILRDADRTEREALDQYDRLRREAGVPTS